MAKEENIVQELVRRFTYLEGKVEIRRPRRISLEVDYAHFLEVFDFSVKALKFPHLCTITGLDERDNLSFIYHLAEDSGILLNIKTSVPKSNPQLDTVIKYFPGAEVYVREVVDLFGAKVKGLPSGHRYPLTDEWPTDQFPLSKDWKPVKKEEEHKDA